MELVGVKGSMELITCIVTYAFHHLTSTC